jgi:hypothetical protein
MGGLPKDLTEGQWARVDLLVESDTEGYFGFTQCQLSDPASEKPCDLNIVQKRAMVRYLSTSYSWELHWRRAPDSLKEIFALFPGTGRASVEDQPSRDRLAAFGQTFERFVAGNEQDFVLTRAAQDLGELAIPELQRRLSDGFEGSEGRAAVIALQGLPPDLALPLIRVAFGSSYNATRFYAAQYLEFYPTAAAKELARERLAKETYETARKALERSLAT